MATYLIGLLYRNTRTSCVSLALLDARVSHDTLRCVLYQKLPWSRRLWESFAQGLVQMGGYVVIDDTRWERFTRVADAVSWTPSPGRVRLTAASPTTSAIVVTISK